MINRTPQIMTFSVVFYEDLVDVPSPIPVARELHNSTFLDLARKHRAEPVSPEADSFEANIDAACEKQVLNVPQ